MERNDDYGLNPNEKYIYRLAWTILLYEQNLTGKDIDEAMKDAIDLGTRVGKKIIDGDYNY